MDAAAAPPSVGAVVGKRLGILGGGQLGRMLTLAAAPLGVRTTVLDPAPDCPAALAGAAQLVGPFTDAAKIADLARQVDVLTVEIEHINAAALAEAAAATGVPVHPAPSTIALIQDKLRQKDAMAQHGVPLGRFRGVDSEADVAAAGEELGYPLMLKARLLAYDGRGNAMVRSAADIPGAWAALAKSGGGLFAEAWVPFVRELAVIVARTPGGQCAAYPAVHTIQKDSICHVVLAPAQGVDTAVLERARGIATAAVSHLEGAGVFGVELFELPDGRVLYNEIAPRVHNSGHYSIEAAHCSQFEQHVRAVLGLPLGDTALRVPAAAMINVLGTGDGEEAGEVTWRLCGAALATPGASVHWYAKGGAMKRGRKVGHVTVTGASGQAVLASVRALLAAGGVGDAALAGVSASPVVGVIMGSDSDLPVMAGAAEVLRDFGVPFELTVVSAHRTPARLTEYATTARARGLKVIIAAAGGAAHLPGMVAAMTPLPVIGCPVPLKHLDGVDSLYSIVQMPKGIPVATVAIGNAANAALLAVRMLGASDAALCDRMAAYQAGLEGEVLGKARKLEALGWEAYLAAKK